MYRIISFTNRDSFISSLPICRLFLFFFWLIVMPRTSSTVLKMNGKSRHSCIVLDLSVKAFTYSFYLFISSLSHLLLCMDLLHLFFVVGNLEIICPTSNIFKVTLKFYAKMGSIKDRNVRDLTETEDIKMRWQEYTEKLYKKDLHDPDNHDGVITHLEPDIL